MHGGQRRGPLRDAGSASGALGGRAAAVSLASRPAPGGRLRRAAQGRPPRDGALCLSALLGPASPRRPARAGPGLRSRRRDHAPGHRGRPARTGGAGGSIDRRCALPHACADRRPRVAAADSVGARVPGAGSGGRGLPARRRGRRDRAAARASGRGARTRAHPRWRPDPRRAGARDQLRSLRARRSGLDADGLRAAPPSAVADAEPLALEGLPKVAVRSLDDYRRTRA